MNHVLENVLTKHQSEFHAVVDFAPAQDKLLAINCSATNKALTAEMIADTDSFSAYINSQLSQSKARYGIGGYNENRIIYQSSSLFGNAAPSAAARTIHLGIDIWGEVSTKVYAPQGGMVHSFAYNEQAGDYGATIILQHQLDTIVFHTLYGHLSFADLAPMQEGKYISRGEVIGHFGPPAENGNWPPHLHFQLIEDMRIKKGDYPGVCAIGERAQYLHNCPNPDLILNMLQYLS